MLSDVFPGILSQVLLFLPCRLRQAARCLTNPVSRSSLRPFAPSPAFTSSLTFNLLILHCEGRASRKRAANWCEREPKSAGQHKSDHVGTRAWKHLTNFALCHFSPRRNEY